MNCLNKDARWPVWSALDVYRDILDAIEANGYDNFTQRAYVPKLQKFAMLPTSFVPKASNKGRRKSSKRSLERIILCHLKRERE